MGSKGDDVLQSVAPFAIDTPSIGVGVAAVTILHVVSAVLVEIYVRYFRPQIGLSGGVS
jgi:sarcosine oxidase gamma subunit